MAGAAAAAAASAGVLSNPTVKGVIFRLGWPLGQVG